MKKFSHLKKLKSVLICVACILILAFVIVDFFFESQQWDYMFSVEKTSYTVLYYSIFVITVVCFIFSDTTLSHILVPSAASMFLLFTNTAQNFPLLLPLVCYPVACILNRSQKKKILWISFLVWIGLYLLLCLFLWYMLDFHWYG